MVDSLHGIIPLIPCASCLISAGLPYLSIVEFYFILSSVVSVHIWRSIIENLLYYVGLSQSQVSNNHL